MPQALAWGRIHTRRALFSTKAALTPPSPGERGPYPQRRFVAIAAPRASAANFAQTTSAMISGVYIAIEEKPQSAHQSKRPSRLECARRLESGVS